MNNLQEVNDFLYEMTGVQPTFKNSLQYYSTDWTTLDFCEVEFPVQRRLTKYECVFDLDDVSQWNIHMIPKWLNSTGFKFIAWQSGPSGLHIHFWTNVAGKEEKKLVTQLLAEKIEDKFGIKNDIAPMGHGHIRAEFSFHPIKGYRKTFRLANISPLFPKNDLSPEIMKKVDNISRFTPQSTSFNAPIDGKTPKCIRYMTSNQFSDGRERIIFSLISWWKGAGLSDDAIFNKLFDWCNSQNYHIGAGQLKSKIRSSQGRVGCRYRHQLLEDLGHDIGECDWK